MQKKRKLTLAVSLFLAAIMIASATYAWFVATDKVRNTFRTAMITNGTVAIVEKFDPPTEWKPGQKVNKEVGVINYGNGGVLVRISFEEYLMMLGKKVAGEKVIATSTAIPALASDPEPGFVPMTDQLKVVDADKLNGAQIYVKDNQYIIAYQIPAGNAEFGGRYQELKTEVSLDSATKTLTIKSVDFLVYSPSSDTLEWPVAKPAEANIGFAQLDPGKMISLEYDALKSDLSDDSWFYNAADGYFYYIGKLEKNDTTSNLLKSVTLSKDAGNDYAGIEFDLTVKMEAYQNTQDILTDAWNLDPTTVLYAKLATFCE